MHAESELIIMVKPLILRVPHYNVHKKLELNRKLKFNGNEFSGVDCRL